MLEDALACWLLNARHLRNVPGRKTDVADAQWICQLVEHGLVRPSFVPPKPIRELRNLTRYRKAQVEERTREAQRLDKVLQDAGVKLSSVAGDVLGKSGRDVLAALAAGTRDPEVLAALRATVATQAADAQPAASTPSSPCSGPGLLGRAWNRVKAGAHQAGSALTRATRRVRQAASTAWGGLRLLQPFRAQILIALGVGAAAGVGAYCAGPYVAAGAGWLAGVLGALAVQAGVALRRLTAQANFSL